MMRDDNGLQILIKKRDETKRAADNVVKAIEQGIIMDFTKDRLTALQDELNRLEIEINKEAQKSYAHLTVQEVEKYLLTKVFENPDDIKTRKLLVNTFIREIIWYGDRLVITYNFQENVIPERLTKSHIEEVEKQIEEATQSAFSFSLCSSKFRHSAPASPQGDGRECLHGIVQAFCFHSFCPFLLSFDVLLDLRDGADILMCARLSAGSGRARQKSEHEKCCDKKTCQSTISVA